MRTDDPNLLVVLDDGETFSSAHCAQILIAPSAVGLTQYEMDVLDDGRLPAEWFDPSVRERPTISLELADNGDLVARYHGFGEQRDRTTIVLADGDLLRRLP